MSDSVRPHRRQPTRLPRPWDSPGKNTGVGGHFLLQCMKVKSESEVAQSCPTLRDPIDYSPPGSSTHGILQARVLEWGAIAFSKKTSMPGQITNVNRSTTVRKSRCNHVHVLKTYMRVPWTARRSNQSTRKEISPEYSLEGLKLKPQYFGHLR